jgi:hypothetical protein
MRTFLLAGFLYLLGTGLILFIKPSLMFTKEGVWKEFGIGRNPATHTWLPFWLFAIMWAIVSYIISLILVRVFFSSPPSNSCVNVTKRNKKPKNVVFEEVDDAIQGSEGSEGSESSPDQITRNSLPTGYYVLNTTKPGNVEPNYVYLGKRLPKG